MRGLISYTVAYTCFYLAREFFTYQALPRVTYCENAKCNGKNILLMVSTCAQERVWCRLHGQTLRGSFPN